MVPRGEQSNSDGLRAEAFTRRRPPAGTYVAESRRFTTAPRLVASGGLPRMSWKNRGYRNRVTTVHCAMLIPRSSLCKIN